MADRLARPMISSPPGPEPDLREPVPLKPGPARKLLRQSTLLLVGRVLSKVANFATQILIVRYLSQSAYGGFAYALSVATVLQNLVGLGLDRSIVRFLPIYQERRDTPRLFGTIVMALLVIVSLGLVAAGALFGLRGLLGRWVPNSETTLPLLFILVFLAPLQALDDLLVGMFAVFAKARSIFFRRFLLAPVLRLVVAAAMVAGGGDVFLLAIGYVASSVLGLALYGWMLIRVLRQEGLMDQWSIGALRLPWKEVLGFTFPLLTTDLTYAAMTTLSVILLGHSWGTAGVAALTAVQPAARMNEFVMQTFGILYVPLASRMFAKQDRHGINSLYWRTAIWIAIFSFPVFALTFSLARPITVLLFGARYAASAPLLAILSLGYYVNAATGHNGLTLKVFGKVRPLVVINLITMGCSVLLSALLIPRFGALGAAIAICSALIIHNALKQLGLKLGTGVRLFEPEYLRVYAGIALCSVGLLAISALISPPVYVVAALALLGTWVLLRLNSRTLELGETFPEANRWPGVRFLLPRRAARDLASNGRPPQGDAGFTPVRTALVTDADRGSALSIIRSLGRRGWNVIAAGEDPSCIGFRSRYASERLVYPGPSREPAAFVESVLAAVSAWRVDLIIPVTDAAILPLQHERTRIRAVSQLALPDDTDSVRAVMDKSRTMELAASLGVPVPRGVLANSAETARLGAQRLGWPVVLKPRSSRVLQGERSIDSFEVSYAGSMDDLTEMMRRLEGRCDVLVQEYCGGVGRGVGLLMHEGRPIAAFQHRRMHEVPITGGASSLRESEALDPALYDYSVRILSALRWTGLAMVEFKVGADGPKLMEVNGRVWGSLPLAISSGVDFPALLGDLYLAGPPREGAPPLLKYRVGVRSRNLALDITWILTTLSARRRYPFVRTPSRGEALLGLVGLIHPRYRFDVQSFSDPGPGIAEIPKILRHLWRKVRR